MKKIILGVAIATLFISYQTSAQAKNNQKVAVSIDLTNVKDDKVQVTVLAPAITEKEIVYNLPKIIPGTYSVDDYGKFTDDFTALDSKGNALEVSKLDENSWKIKNASKLNKVTYWVNDTFDIEGNGGFGKGVFSPAGTNIIEGKNFLINNHGFVGYFENKKDINYQVTITHPETLFGATSLVDTDNSATSDVFSVARYNDLVDNPIMYSAPDYTTFNVDGMDILFSVYSPNGKHSAKELSPALEKCMRAQKKFLGPINTNKRYTVLLYLSDMNIKDAKGFGALEHNSSTSVVFPELMPNSALGKELIDVVSHEFFHIVTPLGVHSNEIHYFDFNAPKMSQHLWMYEGVTEYFANLFQVNQGLITEEAFYKRMIGKINNSKRLNDTMPFTLMSENVLVEPYKDQYLNVYEKGALIGMCVDIIIREKSNGERGILDLMQKLTNEYGPKRPFNDKDLFAKITEFTYPEVGEFLNTYVAGPTPINYDSFFAKMGVAKSKIKKAINPFIYKKSAGITGTSNKEIKVKSNSDLSPFLTQLGLIGDDIITSINGTNYNLDQISDLMTAAQSWKDGDAITMKIKRDGKEMTLSGKVILSFEESEGYFNVDASKAALKDAWLKK
ncbi:peptidase M61 [Flavobacterium sp.]|uniref:M61 family metallopeptidase n=1 Tax=Flavobacterium sp. TaxID=239 RepID=UPI0038D0FE82